VIVAVVAADLLAAALQGCDLRGAFAQSELFSGLRPELIEQCCTCLSLRGTGDATASCSEAILVDGLPSLPPGAVVGSGNRASDLNDERDEGEIPCLCNANRETCIAALSTDGDVLIPGACVDQLDQQAPCESACAGELSFSPIQPAG
jgi:hypothetical protein